MTFDACLPFVIDASGRIGKANPATQCLQLTEEIRHLPEKLSDPAQATPKRIEFLEIETATISWVLDAAEQAGFQPSLARKALAGFFISGLLMAFTGAILPAWGFGLRPGFIAAGNYFLCINLGLLASLPLARPVLRRQGLAVTLALGFGLAFGSLTALAFSGPSHSDRLRFAGFAGVGLSEGLINTALFHSISPVYRQAPAATVNLAGTFFCLGCFSVAGLVASTFNTYTVPSILFFIALGPGFLAIAYARMGGIEPYPIRRSVSREFRGPVAVFFSAILFLQFGNEWAIAGWLPLFLVQRLGVSPARALTMLALYWLALLVGRLVMQALIPRVSHARILTASVIAAMFGCLVLSLTNNLFGATLGTLFIGLGFAAIYPLVVQRIGTRFPSFHPGLYNGVFSLALTGGLLTPALLGYLAEYSGVRIVMLAPAAGASLVFLAVVALMLHDHLSSKD